MAESTRNYERASLANLLENTHRVEAIYSRQAGETSPCDDGGKSRRASVKGGGDSRRRLRMCSTKGRWVVDPWETSVRKADLSRTGGTVRRI